MAGAARKCRASSITTALQALNENGPHNLRAICFCGG
jgi:hypothetical protein